MHGVLAKRDEETPELLAVVDGITGGRGGVVPRFKWRLSRDDSRSIYRNPSPVPLVASLVTIAAVLLASMTLINLLSNPDRSRRVLFLIIWVIGPPIWFWIEYFYLFRIWGKADKFDEFKHGQDLSAKIWLGIVALLTADLIQSG